MVFCMELFRAYYINKISGKKNNNNKKNITPYTYEGFSINCSTGDSVDIANALE